MATEVKDDECSICRYELYLDPSMKLRKSDCGHNFCEKCIKRTFQSRVSLRCPVCKAALTKESFGQKEDIDPEFEKEMIIRKSIIKDFNKRSEDFKTLRQYNDYLEEVEDIIYNLVNFIDVEKTQERIKKYKLENQELIVINQAKKSEEDRQAQERMSAEKGEKEEKKKAQIMEEQIKVQEQVKKREQLLKDLGAEKITPDQFERMSKVEPPKIKIEMAQPQRPFYIPQAVSKPLEPQIDFSAPQPMEIERVEQPLSEKQREKLRYTQFRAGGWKDEYITRRSMEEAIAMLYLEEEIEKV